MTRSCHFRHMHQSCGLLILTAVTYSGCSGNVPVPTQESAKDTGAIEAKDVLPPSSAVEQEAEKKRREEERRKQQQFTEEFRSELEKLADKGDELYDAKGYPVGFWGYYLGDQIRSQYLAPTSSSNASLTELYRSKASREKKTRSDIVVGFLESMSAAMDNIDFPTMVALHESPDLATTWGEVKPDLALVAVKLLNDKSLCPGLEHQPWSLVSVKGKSNPEFRLGRVKDCVQLVLFMAPPNTTIERVVTEFGEPTDITLLNNDHRSFSYGFLKLVVLPNGRVACVLLDPAIPQRYRVE